MAVTNVLEHPSPTIGRASPSVVGAHRDITPAAVAGLAMKTHGALGVVRQTVFTLTNMLISITDALAYASQLLGTFPEGRINVIDCVTSLTLTNTTALDKLNASAVVSHGVGSAAASSITLATTMQNFMPGSGEAVNNFTADAAQNVPSAVKTGILAAVSAAHLAAIVDGRTTASPIYLNLGVPTNTEIDADAIVAMNGTIVITWTCTGDT